MIACQQAERTQQSVNYTQRGYKTMRQTLKIICAAVLTAALLTGGTALAGTLDPTAAPAPTMRTLEQLKPVWDRIIPAAQRFVDALDGTAVLDKETGLVWAKNANLSNGALTWQLAMNYCPNLSVGGRKGWRLPTVEELASLVDPTQSNPSLPSGHPFTNVQSSYYWSSSSFSGDSSYAWNVHMYSGTVSVDFKTVSFYVWPVRGGQ